MHATARAILSTFEASNHRLPCPILRSLLLRLLCLGSPELGFGILLLRLLTLTNCTRTSDSFSTKIRTISLLCSIIHNALKDSVAHSLSASILEQLTASQYHGIVTDFWFDELPFHTTSFLLADGRLRCLCFLVLNATPPVDVGCTPTACIPAIH